jgi:pimeloyl-ACP methyl ester carboxylesterase
VPSATIEVDVSAVAPPGCRRLVADVFVPSSDGEGHRPQPVAFFCFPGGGMSRRYHDLHPDVPADAGGGYSFAEHLAARGHLVVTVDHPGVGDSDRPDDGYALTPAAVAEANAAAVGDLRRRVDEGRLVEGLGPVAGHLAVGLGHSMGARNVAVQQARHGRYDAVCLLGIGARGLFVPATGADGRLAWVPPDRNGSLDERELSYAGRPDALERDIVEQAEAHYKGDPLPLGTTATSPLLLAGMTVPPPVLTAIGETATSLLALCGLTSMIPGGTAPDMAAVTVPVFVGAGERDITGPQHDIPAAFTAATDVTLFVLAGAGHNHNVAPNRRLLWDRVTAWAEGLQVLSVT